MFSEDVGLSGSRAVAVSRSLAKQRIKGDDATAGEQAVCPLVGNGALQLSALDIPPSIAAVLQRIGQCAQAALVPFGADAGWAVASSSGLRRRNAVLGAKQIKALEARASVAARAAGILKCAAKLPVVEVLHIADGKQPYAEFGVVDDVMTKVRRHGESIENKCLHIL